MFRFVIGVAVSAIIYIIGYQISMSYFVGYWAGIAALAINQKISESWTE